MSEEILAVLFLPGFLVGLITACVILIAKPQLYRKLRCKKCFGSEESIMEKEERLDSVTDIGDATKSNDYSEIDEKDTINSPIQISVKKKGANKERGYENCAAGNQTHRYSDLHDETSGAGANHKTANNSYEPFTPVEIAKKQEITNETHDYFILEPGSDKRLPVKPLLNKEETLRRDPGVVYFILEPGTNRVKPVSQYLGDNENGSSDNLDSGHIYFKLEPMAETNESESLAYAVNDIATNPTYFILEKPERYA